MPAFEKLVLVNQRRANRARKASRVENAADHKTIPSPLPVLSSPRKTLPSVRSPAIFTPPLRRHTVTTLPSTSGPSTPFHEIHTRSGGDEALISHTGQRPSKDETLRERTWREIAQGELHHLGVRFQEGRRRGATSAAERCTTRGRENNGNYLRETKEGVGVHNSPPLQMKTPTCIIGNSNTT